MVQATDLTPRPSALSWSIFELLKCCRPPAASPSPVSLSSEDNEERSRHIDEGFVSSTAAILYKAITADGEKTVRPRRAVRISAETVRTSKDNYSLCAKLQDDEKKRSEEEKLRSKVGLLEAGLVRLKKDNAAKATEVAALEKSLVGISKNRDDLLRDKGLMEAERDELTAAKGRIQEEVESLLKNIAEITAENAAEVDAVRRDLEANMTKRGEQSVAKIVYLERELGSTRSSLVDTTTVRDKLAAETDRLHQQIRDLQSDISKISSDRELEVGNLQMELELAQEQLSEAEDCAGELTKELAESGSLFESTHRSMESLTEQLDAERTAKEKLQEEMVARICEIMRQKEALGQEVERLLAQIEHVNQEHNLLSLQFDKMAKEKDETIQCLSEEVQCAKDKINSASTELKDAQKAASQREEKFRCKVESLEADLIQSEQDVECLKHDKESMQKEILDISLERNSMREEILTISSENECLLAEKHSFLDRLNEEKKDAGRVQEELSSAEEEICKLKDDLSAVHIEHCKLIESLDEMTNQKDSLSKELAEQLSKENISEKQYLQHQVESLMNDVEEISISKRKEIETLHNENNSLQEVVGKLLAEVAEVTSATLSAQLNAANTDKDQIEMTIANRIDEAMKQKDGQIKEMAQQIKNLISEVEHANKGSNSLLAELTDAKNTACETQAQLSMKVTSLEIDLLESKEDAAANMSMVESLQKEINSFAELDTNSPSAPTPATANSTMRSSSEDLSDRLTSLPPSSSPSSPPIFASSKPDNMTMSLNSPVVLSSNPPSSFTADVYPCCPNANGSATPAITLEGFSHQGLTVEFKCIKVDPFNLQKSLIIFRFKNCTNAPLSGLHLKVAVPKFVTMKLKPPTSTTVPVAGANKTEDVTQSISITNTLLGKKNLVLKIKASFISNGTEVEHLAVCSGFPDGQF